MQKAKWLAIGLCILFVLGAYAAWNYAFSRFNPNPVSTTLSSTYTCSTAGSCGEFRIVSANLSLQGGEGAVSEGIVSQSLNLQIDTLGEVPMSSVQVFVDNISVGSESGPFTPGMYKLLYFPVPTIITVNPGQAYTISVEGTFPSQSTAGSTTSFLQSIRVVASD